MISARTNLLRAVAVAALLAQLTACGGAQSQEQSQELQGAPPTAREDPFFFVAMPAEAEPAETTGMIGEEETPAAAAPPEGAPEPPPKTSPDQVQCFSCVKICAVTDPQCEGSEDVICGWGVDDAREQASQMAAAQCDGALDLARETRRWGRIEGDCPAASCR